MDFDIMREMKFLSTVVTPLLLAFPVQGVTVPMLPFDAAVLSETVTNIPFAVDFEAMSRIKFTLALNASPTNFVEVAYRARSASGSTGDVKAVATFTEEESGEKITSEATLTAVEVKIRPVRIASGNESEWRHKYGVYERIRA